MTSASGRRALACRQRSSCGEVSQLFRKMVLLLRSVAKGGLVEGASRFGRGICGADARQRIIRIAKGKQGAAQDGCQWNILSAIFQQLKQREHVTDFCSTRKIRCRCRRERESPGRGESARNWPDLYLVARRRMTMSPYSAFRGDKPSFLLCFSFVHHAHRRLTIGADDAPNPPRHQQRFSLCAIQVFDLLRFFLFIRIALALRLGSPLVAST